MRFPPAQKPVPGTFVLTAMTLSTGAVLWTYDGGTPDFSPVAILNGSLYASANSGANALAAFSLPPAP